MNVRTRSYMLADAAMLPGSVSGPNPRGPRSRELTERAGRRDRVVHGVVRFAFTLFASAGAIALPVAAVMATNGWTADISLKHFAAALGCDVAQHVGLPPARAGHPGYWPWLDHDGDGIACER